MQIKHCTVEEEYQKNKELKKEDVVLLQEWMRKEAHLPKISDYKVILFLHACYYKIEPTKACIESFFTLKAHWPEFSLKRNVQSEEIQRTLRTMLVVLLPLRSKQNHQVVYCRLLDTNPEVYDHITQLKVFDIIGSMYITMVGTAPGQVLVMDMEGATIGHIFKINLAAMKKHLYYVQEALPVRLKGIHLINVSPISDKILSIAKPFMHKEMVDMMHLHSKIDTLFEYVPKAALPNEYGGEAGTFKELHEAQLQLVQEHAEQFIADEKEIADESKRQGKPKNLDNIFGIEGTFKKLDID